MKNDEIDPKKLPIYKKGMEIFEVVDQICQLIPDNDEMLGHVKSRSIRKILVSRQFFVK